MSIEIKSRVRCFDGHLVRFSHVSHTTHTSMTAAVYLPRATPTDRLPCLLYLSGLTCTDENVCTKGGPLFKELSDRRMAFIAPDTSPRGAGIAGETDSWDLGVGAGFYVDAVTAPWSSHYRMYSYVLEELLPLVAKEFPTVDTHRLGVSGHSMGGHGALVMALRNPSRFKSVSAFAPICHPSVSPWGIKAFTAYLGVDTALWKDYDATELMTRIAKPVYADILIDVGTSDAFFAAGQLLPEDLKKVCDACGQKLSLRFQDEFDHSYYFVSSFIADHVRFHAAALASS